MPYSMTKWGLMPEVIGMMASPSGCYDRTRKKSQYAPIIGFRYDGIYKVVKYWPHKGKSGFVVWRYLFRRDDPNPAPWEEGAFVPPCIMKKVDEAEEEQKPGKGKKRPLAAGSLDKFISKKPKIEEYYQPDAEFGHVIKADVRNKKLWQACLEAKKPSKLLWSEEVETTFTCLVCFEILYQPITLDCSHNACKKCLQKSFEKGHYECWSCRAKLDKAFDFESHLNEECSVALKKIFPGYDKMKAEEAKASKKPQARGRRKAKAKNVIEEESE